MPSKTASWQLLNSGADTAARNMALDAALLELGRDLPGPVLRFYSWTEPAASFGYFQKFAEAEKMTHLRPLVRRPTGGGLVPHDSDWTYSLTLPPDSEWYGLSATESYRRMHEWIRAAFAKIGVNVELASACRKALPGQCFVGHEKFDVLWQGRKIAGAAQRRTRSGLLIQGSVQPAPIVATIPLAPSEGDRAGVKGALPSSSSSIPSRAPGAAPAATAQPPCHSAAPLPLPLGDRAGARGMEGLSRAKWEQAMVEAAPASVGRERRDFTLPPALVRRRDELAAGTYSQPSHNCRR